MGMRYWYDWEFLEDGPTIEPISIGIVAEDDRQYYAVMSEVETDEGLRDRLRGHRWLMTNVVPHLPLAVSPEQSGRSERSPYGRFCLDMNDSRVKPRWVIANEVRDFLLVGGDVELWGWYSAYDHVCLAQLWGPMVHRPKGIPMWINDLRQEAHRLGIAQEDMDAGIQADSALTEHNALHDALMLRERYWWVREHADTRPVGG
jgi:3' exoribonuclease, RNase T-like